MPERTRGRIRSDPRSPRGGIWVDSPTVIDAARLKLVVPMVRCAVTKSATAIAGLFGATTAGARTSPWQLTVVAACRHGTTTYRSVTSDVSGRSSLLRVHADERARPLVSGALAYEINDHTTRASAGSGSAVASGAQPELGTPVLFGARVSGHVGRQIT